ncbi:MAG: hypothetical protein DMF06_06880 [Verrucomicrobia bacterium]|nr:MAG: hypothetical protein DMF06_06880 [Verrucomicrobiota bacterium]
MFLRGSPCSSSPPYFFPRSGFRFPVSVFPLPFPFADRSLTVAHEMTEDDFQYAIENTRVILAPERQIASFGSTSFRFYLISELMDQVNEVRVRDGRIHAERPQILTPEHYCRLLLEGFGEKAQKYVDQLREHTRNVSVLRYGFQFRKTDVTEHTVRDTMDAVIERTKRKVQQSEEPLSAVIQGVDDAWEVCLLKFTIDLIERSTGGNLGDFRRRGLV